MVDDQKAQIWPFLPKAIDFIDQAVQRRKKEGTGGVLVMSTNGKSRPVTIVISYLMYVNKMSLADAYAFVKLKRSSSLPNANFMSQLSQFEEVIKVGNAKKEVPVSLITKYMTDKPIRKPYNLFRGVSDSTGLVDISAQISDKVGLKLDHSRSRSTVPVLQTRTNLNEISQIDLATLVVNNRKETQFNEGKLASILSKNVLEVYFGDKKREATELIGVFDRKHEKHARAVQNQLMSLRKPSVFAVAAEHQMMVTNAVYSPSKRNALRHAITNEIANLSRIPEATTDASFKIKTVSRIQEQELAKISPATSSHLEQSRRASSVQPPFSKKPIFLTQSGRQMDLSLALTAQKKPLTVIEEPVEIDPYDPTQRYESKYVPPNADKISPLQSMKYNLSKQQLKVHQKFAKKLADAILEGRHTDVPTRQTLYVCRNCEFLLFREQDIVSHAPVPFKTEDHLAGSNLRFIDGSTVQLNIDSVTNLPDKISPFSTMDQHASHLGLGQKQTTDEPDKPIFLNKNSSIQIETLNTLKGQSESINSPSSYSLQFDPRQPLYKSSSMQKKSKVSMGQKLSCCEYFVRRRDWMILGLNYSLNQGDLYCPVGTCRQKVGVFAIEKQFDRAARERLETILQPLKGPEETQQMDRSLASLNEARELVGGLMCTCGQIITPGFLIFKSKVSVQ